LLCKLKNQELEGCQLLPDISKVYPFYKPYT
jgi:hypothetical protein